MLAAFWILWAVWVVSHYFAVPPPAGVALWEGDLFPAPYWRDALARASAACAGAGLTAAAAWGIGVLVLKRIRALFADATERLLFELAVGFVVLSGACLALAGAGLYRPSIVRTLVVGVAAAASIIAVWRRPRRAGGRATWRVGFDAFPWFAVTAVAIAFALAAALAPEIEHDALWYHLWLPQRWLAAGRPIDLVHEYPALYPLAWELLFGAAMTVGGPVAGKLLHFLCLPLVGLATWKLAGLAIAARRDRAAAAAIAVVSPTILWEATTAYVDLALAWYATLGVYALLRYAQAADRRWLLLGGAMFGTAASIKHLGLVACASAGLVLALVEFKRHGFRSVLRACATLFLVALLLPSPWYVRAYAASGNPVFPDFYGVFGARPAERWDDTTERALRSFKDRFGRERTAASLAGLPWDVTVHGARYAGTPGPIFLLLVPVALLAGSKVRLLLLGCATYVLVWASPISSFQFRFLVPILPVLAVVAAAGLSRIPRALAWVIVLLLVLNLPPFTAWHERDRHGWSGWLSHVGRALPLPVVIGAETPEQYVARHVPSYPVWQFINTALPADARILTFSGGDHLYSERDRLWSDATGARPATWGARRGDEAKAREALANLAITHVLVDVRQASAGDARDLAISSPEMRACCLDRVYGDARFVLYRVR